MTFDEKLKARAAREGSPIPEGFDSRMDALLDTLPAGVQPAKKRRAPRLAVCIGIAAAMVVGAAAAAPAILKMAQGAVNYFQSDQESVYAPLQTEYERFNAAVGMHQTVDGVTLSIDNIAVDDSYMSIFFTVSSETPLSATVTLSVLGSSTYLICELSIFTIPSWLTAYSSTASMSTLFACLVLRATFSAASSSRVSLCLLTSAVTWVSCIWQNRI